MAKAAPKRNIVAFLRTYRFRENEKDPIIDCIHTLMKDADQTVQSVHRIAGVSSTTLYNWFDGPTRRPQFATASAVLRAIGYELGLIKSTRSLDKIWDATPPQIIFLKPREAAVTHKGVIKKSKRAA